MTTTFKSSAFTTLLISCFFTLLTLFSVNEVSAQNSFKHTTKSDNITRHMTTLDNPLINGNNNVLIFASQEYGKYNTHQIGVWYNSSKSKWAVYNEDKAAMPENTHFNVFVVPTTTDYAFSHKATKNNIASNWTIIDHPKSNNNPNAVLLVTQNWTGVYNPKAIGVWYTRSGKWAIFNQDKSDMPEGTNFNVMVLEEGKTKDIRGGEATIVTAKATNKVNGAGKHVVNSTINNSKKLGFVTQNWKGNGVYNNHIVSVWKSKGKYTVYNQDKAEIPNNAMFNMVFFNNDASPIIDVLRGQSSDTNVLPSRTTISNYVSDQAVYSPNRKHKLVIQTDGNLVVYNNGVANWSTATYGPNYGQGRCEMHADGNLMLVDAKGKTLWSSNTGGNVGAKLYVQDDGNVVVKNTSGATIWHSNTANGQRSNLNASERQF